MWRKRVYCGELRHPIQANDDGERLCDLLQLLQRTQTSLLPSDVPSDGMRSLSRIVTGLYLGNEFAARDKLFLNYHGFTHVINTAEGALPGQVNTGADYYKNSSIKYIGFPLIDVGRCMIVNYFDEVADYINAAIKSGGKVLIHCQVGISRSASFVIAYLVKHHAMNVDQAIRHIFQRRKIWPNNGFLDQLAFYYRNLQHSRSPVGALGMSSA